MNEHIDPKLVEFLSNIGLVATLISILVAMGCIQLYRILPDNKKVLAMVAFMLYMGVFSAIVVYMGGGISF